jgi:hypothetical protein
MLFTYALLNMYEKVEKTYIIAGTTDKATERSSNKHAKKIPKDVPVFVVNVDIPN